MVEVGQSLVTFVLPPPVSVMESFQRVNSLIPEDQEVVCVNPEMTVAQAIDLMKQYNYSQLPVTEGEQILGVFSFRSFALEAMKLGKEQIALDDLPVSEFIERVEHILPSANLESVFPALNRDGVILVGQPDLLQGVVTPVDVFHYLHKVASPFILLGEIELALRQLIKACVDDAGLKKCAELTLQQWYKGRTLPMTLEDMTFNDYLQILGDENTWPLFQRVFGGAGDLLRTRTRSKLKEIKDLRNIVFHFKRKLDPTDYEILVAHRDWLRNKARAFEAKAAGR